MTFTPFFYRFIYFYSFSIRDGRATLTSIRCPAWAEPDLSRNVLASCLHQGQSVRRMPCAPCAALSSGCHCQDEGRKRQGYTVKINLPNLRRILWKKKSCRRSLCKLTKILGNLRRFLVNSQRSFVNLTKQPSATFLPEDAS